ncbi:hypothetical protein UFOVP1058_27 [uncultured Caudovirales phage]|uniref:Uncharacterized protein n=1 Tax=uncultured Caudovirales phage TaxID=2100421 RepID=A0A6J5S8K4_9CAUD|nr:hypothetical protein UFOVP656_53 [uncultured Caudovirales phage]CAB4167205.1 hypothetical protein UFOVP857_6 [uncultured Caudovirales phage]CAB4168462.1 hypothetical protein UFOVP879_40 [uncultured Caudovirales phage]CAB4181311.1 hypothetical protein UFOVP1058_27 [uncultured Caudovirales phage]CAB4195897.1 hypothetical protein UFOVP1289_51 [uncultured Caudovirales phage]
MNAPYAPIAKHLASHGRGEDSVLIHMTPKEVGGLQALAMAHGGSLTINPHTGLPEAGWLGKLLPMILGAAAMFIPGVNAAVAAGVIGAGTGIAKGSLTEGLMAGLSAFGGASLAAGLGAGAAGAVADTAATAGTAAADTAATAGGVTAGMGAEAAASLGGIASGTALPTGGALMGALPAATPGLAAGMVPPAFSFATPFAADVAAPAIFAPAASAVAPTVGMVPPAFSFATPLATDVATPAILAPAASTVAPTVGGAAGFPSSLSEFGTRFSEAAGKGIGGAGRIPTSLATMGLLGGAMGAMQPSDKMPEEEEDKYPYKGPYLPMERRAIFRAPGDPSLLTDSSERNYFEPSNPYPGYIENPNYVAPVSPNVKTRFADGGDVPMAEKDYGFNAFRSQIPPSRPSGMFNDSIGFMGSGMDYTNAISAMLAQQDVYSGSAFPGLGAPTPRAPSAMPPINRPPSGGPAQGQEFDYGFKPMYVPPPPKAPNQPPPGSQQGDQPPLGVQGNQKNQKNQAAQTTQMPYPPSPGAQTNTTYPPPYMMNPVLQQYMSQNQNTSFPQSFAAGGENLRDGAFVVDARTVSEMGNGSSGAGQELLARYGGKPIRGRGDGVSDSVRANIGGVQEARVARDEVKFEPEAVSRLGGGSQQKGAQKLYSLMAKAHKARRKAKPGQDTKLRGLLGA